MVLFPEVQKFAINYLAQKALSPVIVVMATERFITNHYAPKTRHTKNDLDHDRFPRPSFLVAVTFRYTQSPLLNTYRYTQPFFSIHSNTHNPSSQYIQIHTTLLLNTFKYTQHLLLNTFRYTQPFFPIHTDTHNPSSQYIQIHTTLLPNTFKYTQPFFSIYSDTHNPPTETHT